MKPQSEVLKQAADARAKATRTMGWHGDWLDDRSTMSEADRIVALESALRSLLDANFSVEILLRKMVGLAKANGWDIDEAEPWVEMNP